MDLGSDNHLPVSDLLETLEDLLSRVLVLGHADHEADELLERHVAASLADLDELLVHLVFVVDESQAGERG